MSALPREFVPPVMIACLLVSCAKSTEAQEAEGTGAVENDSMQAVLKIDRERNREYFTESVAGIEDVGDGNYRVVFELSARYFRIDSETSEDAEEMAAFARSALEDGSVVHVTVETLGAPLQKAAPSERSATDPVPWVILRLAETPDPEGQD